MPAETNVDFYVKCPLLLFDFSKYWNGSPQHAKFKFNENIGIFSGSGVVLCNQRDRVTE
jgi:hypothetical protein